MKIAVRLLIALCLSGVASAGEVVLEPFRAANGKWGFAEGHIEKSVRFELGAWEQHGKIVLPAEYAWVGFFSSGLARVTKAGAFEPITGQFSGAKWGFIDKTGKEVIAPQYSLADDFRGDHAIVQSGNFFGLIDKTGAAVVPAKYLSFSYFHDGRARVETAAGFGFCDLNGKEVIPLRYQYADLFQDGAARIRRDGKFGWVDGAGTEFGFGEYAHILGFSENLAGAQKDGKWGFADKQGRIAIAAEWDEVRSFKRGLAPVKRGALWGFIDTAGKVAITPAFSHASDFEEVGLAVVGTEKRFAFIRRDGTFAFPQRFSYANSFSAGKASVIFENTWWYIDVHGTMTRPEMTGQRGTFGGEHAPSDSGDLDFLLMIRFIEQKW